MTEKDYELLQILYDFPNLTQAAKVMYTTQSTISKRIQLIEQELGVSILQRSHWGIHFTPAGEAVLQHSKAAATEMKKMRHYLDTISDKICGTLRAGIPLNYATYRLPDQLAQYHQLYPEVKLNITTGQSRHLFQQLENGTIDIAIIRGDYPWSDMKYLLSQEEVCFICHKNHVNHSPSDYMYISHKTDTKMAALISQWMRENHLPPPNNHFCMDNLAQCVEMVRRDLGWSIIPRIALDTFDGIIRPCIFNNGTHFIRSTYVMCRYEMLDLPQIRAFADLLKEKYKKQLIK